MFNNAVETLTTFFTNVRRIAGHDAGYLQAGDILWRLSLNQVDVENDVRVWHDAILGVVGVACFFMIADFEFHLHPNLSDDHFFAIAAEMLQWGKQRYLELAEQETESDEKAFSRKQPQTINECKLP